MGYRGLDQGHYGRHALWKDWDYVTSLKNDSATLISKYNTHFGKILGSVVSQYVGGRRYFYLAHYKDLLADARMSFDSAEAKSHRDMIWAVKNRIPSDSIFCYGNSG